MTSRFASALPGGLLLVCLAVAGTAARAEVPGHPGCPVFPRDNVWHADVSGLPVHPQSRAWLGSMGGPSRRLHPDFGPNDSGGQPYGIPYVVVGADHRKVRVSFQYADESDPGPYPFGPDTPIEGGSDRHAIMVDGETCRLYELFDARYQANRSTAGSGAVWDLRSNSLRPSGWTSADAAGLPIFAGLIRRDEVTAGAIDHAIRVTAERTDRRFVWPARHQAGAASDPDLPPMGARFRMKAGVDISRFRPETQVILRAMKRYGVIVADNGSNWFFGGASEDGWGNAVLDELKSIPAGDFEAVDTSSLVVDANSGRVRGAAPPPPAPTSTTATPPPPPAPTISPSPPPTTATTRRATTSTAKPSTTSTPPRPARPTTTSRVEVAVAPNSSDDGDPDRTAAASLATCALLVVASALIRHRIRNRPASADP